MYQSRPETMSPAQDDVWPGDPAHLTTLTWKLPSAVFPRFLGRFSWFRVCAAEIYRCFLAEAYYCIGASPDSVRFTGP
jgi:hypothetical protein